MISLESTPESLHWKQTRMVKPWVYWWERSVTGQPYRVGSKQDVGNTMIE
jgi:hypothetical protein